MITEIESSIMFLPGNTGYAKLRYYPCTARFHTCQPQGRALASSRKLMPRYLIHWILHHCVQIHIICAKMLVCSWKKKKNLLVKDALGHRDEEVIQGNKKKKNNWKLCRPYLVPTAQQPPELQHHKLTNLFDWQSCNKEGFTSVSTVRKEIW